MSFSPDQPRADDGKWTAGSGSNGPPPGGKFEPGDHVVHPAYGHGRVEQVSKSGGTVSVRYPDDMVVPHSSDDAAFTGRDPDYKPPAEDQTGKLMNPASRLFREHTPEPLSASTGSWKKKRRNEGPVTIINKDGVEDEPRDDKGQWTTSGGGGDTQTFRLSHETLVPGVGTSKGFSVVQASSMEGAARQLMAERGVSHMTIKSRSMSALEGASQAQPVNQLFESHPGAKAEVEKQHAELTAAKDKETSKAMRAAEKAAAKIATAPALAGMRGKDIVKELSEHRGYLANMQSTFAAQGLEHAVAWGMRPEFFAAHEGKPGIAAASALKARVDALNAEAALRGGNLTSKKNANKTRLGDEEMIIFNDATGVLDAARRTSDGYLVAGARVARVGVQKYKGAEVGQPLMDSVVLYRPEEEVFHKDALASMANKPVTLTHPRKMVDAKSWAKVAKGISGTDVVRDGDFVRVPLMLTDAATIDAFEKEGIKELSVGYMADIDWTPGQTPAGEHYDGVQRQIRANHHALVPVARGGKSLTFGDDVGKCPDCGSALNEAGYCANCDDDDENGETWDAAFTAEERADLAKKGQAKPDGSYPIRNVADLKNAISAWGRGGATASDKSWIIKRARALGATSELPEDWGAKDAARNEGEDDMTVQVLVDGVPIQVADQAQATHLLRHLKAIQDAMDEGKTDPDAAAKEQENEKKIRGYKDAIATKDGEIAALRDQLSKAKITDAQLDERISERQAVLDAAQPYLPQGFDAKGKTLAEVRRAAVVAQMGDAAKALNDAAIEGAFSAYTAGTVKPSGVRMMADGMTFGIRGGAHTNQQQINDAEKAYAAMVKDKTEAYKKPIGHVAN